MAQNFCWLVAEAMRLVNCESFYLIFSIRYLLSQTSFLRLVAPCKEIFTFHDFGVSHNFGIPAQAQLACLLHNDISFQYSRLFSRYQLYQS